MDHPPDLVDITPSKLWLRALKHQQQGSYQAAFLDLRRLQMLQPDWPGLLSALQQTAAACNQYRPPRPTIEARRQYQRVTRAGPGMHAGTHPSVEHCEALQLPAGSPMTHVRKRYRQLATTWHPDKWATATPQEQKAAEDRFKTIQSAYEALTMMAGTR